MVFLTWLSLHVVLPALLGMALVLFILRERNWLISYEAYDPDGNHIIGYFVLRSNSKANKLVNESLKKLDQVLAENGQSKYSRKILISMSNIGKTL